jgi:hypothetical protein
MAVIESVIREGGLLFTFPSRSLSSKYDEWVFYRKQFNSAFGGTKAVDIVYASTDIAWLIEVKDFRQHPRTKPQDLGVEVAYKVRDTLAGLAAAACNANDSDEKKVAKTMLKRPKLRVVLHVEQPLKPSRLFPRAIDPADLLQSLKMLLKSVDAHPSVVDCNSLTPQMNWTVS